RRAAGCCQRLCRSRPLSGTEAHKVSMWIPAPLREEEPLRPRTNLDAAAPQAHLSAMDYAEPSLSPNSQDIATITDTIRAYTGSLVFVAVSTLIGLWIAPRWGTAPVDMVYLPAVLGAAALWGLGPGLLAGITSALAYNFFFTAPVHTLRID